MTAAGTNCGECDEWDASAEEFLRLLKFTFDDKPELFTKFEKVAHAVIQNEDWLNQHDAAIAAASKLEGKSEAYFEMLQIIDARTSAYMTVGLRLADINLKLKSLCQSTRV